MAPSDHDTRLLKTLLTAELALWCAGCIVLCRLHTLTAIYIDWVLPLYVGAVSIHAEQQEQSHT